MYEYVAWGIHTTRDPLGVVDGDTSGRNIYDPATKRLAGFDHAGRTVTQCDCNTYQPEQNGIEPHV